MASLLLNAGRLLTRPGQYSLVHTHVDDRTHWRHKRSPRLDQHWLLSGLQCNRLSRCCQLLIFLRHSDNTTHTQANQE